MRKLIMTVDESATIRQMVVFALKNSGYEILEAKNGTDALAKARGGNVNMAITDLNMPDMDGIELIRNLRADSAYRYIPIIILSTESRDDKRQEAKLAGATGWLVKPFRPELLLTVVKNLLA